jgi:tRNA threonylcarbamoyladenosine biosynthesis protein TsaE
MLRLIYQKKMPILAPHAFEFFSHSPEQTRRVGIRLGTLLQKSQTVLLTGNLGSGKTTLVQGIVQGWGSPDLVTSPSFVLMNEYRHPDRGIIFHVDAYRLDSQRPFDLEVLDLDRVLTEGILLVEWADRIEDQLPREHLLVEMFYLNPDQRHLIITPKGKAYQTITKKMQQALFGHWSLV